MELSVARNEQRQASRVSGEPDVETLPQTPQSRRILKALLESTGRRLPNWLPQRAKQFAPYGLVVLALAGLYLAKTQESRVCYENEATPSGPSQVAPAVISARGDLMAHVQGFLRYNSWDTGVHYAPLTVQSAELTVHNSSGRMKIPENYTVELQADNSQITFNTLKNATIVTYLVNLSVSHCQRNIVCSLKNTDLEFKDNLLWGDWGMRTKPSKPANKTYQCLGNGPAHEGLVAQAIITSFAVWYNINTTTTRA